MGEHFRITPWYFWCLLALGVGLNVANVFFPDSIPYDYLWIIGDILYFFSYTYPIIPKFFLVFTAVVHVCEAAYAFKLASDANMSSVDVTLWTTQTLILGVTSLKPLQATCKRLKKKPQ